MKRRKGKQTQLSMKQNELVNEQQIEDTSNNTQQRGNKNNKNENNEQQRTKITYENKDKVGGNNKVRKITDALNLVINRLNILEKSIRPPTKKSVKECTASDLTPTTTSTSAETTISTILQSNKQVYKDDNKRQDDDQVS